MELPIKHCLLAVLLFQSLIGFKINWNSQNNVAGAVNLLQRFNP
ncbi:hypothetical protein amyaer_3699 [Microcystis aeruginosa NIES-2481]|nr:hypothetical protein amyaer_3699 [Microcystis aeruginosa NIES-2481]